jgi:uncharacterized phage protein (TIGR02220 family)
MLLHYYQHRKPFPNDLEKVCRAILAASPEEKRVAEYILGEFFILAPDEKGAFQWHHKRAEHEIAAATERHLSAVERGRKGGLAKAKHSSSSAIAQLKHSSSNQNQNQNQNQNHKPEPKKQKPLSVSPSAKPDPAREILEHLNRNSAHKFRPVEANLRLIRARLAEGYTPERIRWVAAHKIAEWEVDPEMQRYIRPKTLFNAINFAQYDGQIPEIHE